MKTFEVGINPQWPGEKLPKGDSRWGEHTSNFSLETHTLNSFSVRVAGDGCSFAPVMKGNYRDGANFISAQHLVLDDDRETLESSLEALAGDSFIRDHAAVLYETPTSTQERPRSRVVFILDDPITDSEHYRLAQESLLSKFGETDPSVKDAARFFYGRPNARHLILGPWRVRR